MPSALLRTALALSCVLVGFTTASAEDSAVAQRDPWLLIDHDGLRVRARMETANGVFAYSGTWFGLAAQPSQGAFANRRAWAESWVEPGVDGVLRIAPALELYGGAGIGVSRTWGADSFDQRNQGEVNLENAFGGIRTANLATGWNFDFSFGQQNYSVGSGMLIWQGAGNGFERGGGNLLPRQAWKNATVAKVAIAGLSLEGFYLDPNELESVDTGTQLAGAVVQYRWGQKSRAGIASMRALESEQFYPLPSAPLVGFLPGITNGRDGLEAINAFSEIDGASFGLQNAWIRAELSLERNDRIDMLAHAYYGELGYRFLALPFAPALSYAYASFSGDDPTTKRYERFDPLFYGNGLDNWWFGANGAYSFLNSNTAHHRLALQLVLSQQDFVKLQYIHTRANELFSPIQFGQATRPVLTSGGLVLVNGVANAHLADEIYAEWAHVFSKNVTMALWGSAAIPGRGIRDLVSDDATSWLGGGALLSIKY